nr:DUF4224 domain-containing protein [Pseudomonas sp. UBA6718]
MIKFLTPEEIAGLTGFERIAAQRRWLDKNDIPYMEGGDGELKVLEQIVLQRLGGKQQKKAGPQLRLTG